MSSALAPHSGGAAPSGHAGPDGLSAGLRHGKEAAMGAPQHDHDHDHTEPPSEPALRVKALELLLIEKGLVDPQTIDTLIDIYETKDRSP
jgi:hypothetical protein